MSAADLSDDELTAFVKARLEVSGFPLDALPTTTDPATGAPTQDALVASLKSFVLSTPGAINGYRPASGVEGAGDEEPLYAQQAAPPLEYPSIVEAWTGKVAG